MKFYLKLIGLISLAILMYLMLTNDGIYLSDTTQTNTQLLEKTQAKVKEDIQSNIVDRYNNIKSNISDFFKK